LIARRLREAPLLEIVSFMEAQVPDMTGLIVLGRSVASPIKWPPRLAQAAAVVSIAERWA
jgi:hypothetical protein